MSTDLVDAESNALKYVDNKHNGHSLDTWVLGAEYLSESSAIQL